MLGAIDRNSSSWRSVSDHAQNQIQVSMMRLAGHGLGMAETEFERGRIAAFRSVLQLATTEAAKQKYLGTDPSY